MGEVEINDCWSLAAVVRECASKAKLRAQLTADTTRAITTTTNNISPLESSNYSYSQKQSFDHQFILENNSSGFMLPSAAGAATAAPAANDCTSRDEFINDVSYKPFLTNSMVEATNHLVPPSPQQQLQIRALNRRQNSSAIGHHFIDKRKKYEDKRVVKCSLEELSKTEKWAWRKYGQKPIKGSPYPRNYYRCSTMKGCKARKQVERSPVDPNVYIVTYTSYHLHPYPHLRNYHGPRAKPKGPNPDPTPDPDSPTNTEPGQIMSGSGSGSGSGYDGLKVDEELDDNDDGGGGGGDESFGSGGNYNDEDEIFMIPNATADSDLLTGMEQLSGAEKISTSMSTSSSSNDYNKNVVFDEMIINCESRVNNKEVQMKDNEWLEYSNNNNGVGIREMYASAPVTLAKAHESPSSVGNNIWGSAWDH